MSQAGILADSSSPGADVETLTGDTGGAVPPTAFNINLLTGPGLVSTGVAGTSTITFTREDNPGSGTATTVGATTEDLITIDLGATPGVYSIECRVAGFDSVTPSGCGYLLVGAAITDGVSASTVGTADLTINEDAVMEDADIDLVASGNNAIIQVTGVAGLTINWSGFSLYTKVT